MTGYEAAGLFDVEAVPALTATAKRRAAEQRIVGAGFHPLTRGRLHPEADGSPGAPTCGSCRFRQAVKWHDKTYPKCAYEWPSRASHGAASDVLASWPACVDYRPKGRD